MTNFQTHSLNSLEPDELNMFLGRLVVDPPSPLMTETIDDDHEPQGNKGYKSDLN